MNITKRFTTHYRALGNSVAACGRNALDSGRIAVVTTTQSRRATDCKQCLSALAKGSPRTRPLPLPEPKVRAA